MLKPICVLFPMTGGSDVLIHCQTSPGIGDLLRFKVQVGRGSVTQTVIGFDAYSYPSAPSKTMISLNLNTLLAFSCIMIRVPMLSLSCTRSH
jgi:hypothetical protein